MFGRIRKKRRMREEREREARVKEEQEKQRRQQELAAAQDPVKIGQDLQATQEQVGQVMQADEPRRQEQREQFQQEAYEDVTRDIPGMSDEQKRAMRESANAAINSQVQNYSRMLASQSGQRGVRGGAAAAPQVELAEKGIQAQNQFQRDLVEKDADMAMKKLAAYMASLEGKGAEDIIRRQQYFDYITGQQDKAKQDIFSDYFRKYLMGV